jgi:uncharacterized membrane protein
MRTGANIQRSFCGKRVTVLLMAIITSLALMSGGCAMNDTQKRTGTGAAIGAVGGALLGSSRESAVIGAAVGAAGGYMVDQHKKRDVAESENDQLRSENERLRLEAENQRLQEQTGR